MYSEITEKEWLTISEKLRLVDDMCRLTKQLAIEHGNPISDDSAWLTVQDIVRNNYPKCCVKYITGQQWRL